MPSQYIIGGDVKIKNTYDYSPENYADSNSRGHSPIYNCVSTVEYVYAKFSPQITEPILVTRTTEFVNVFVDATLKIQIFLKYVFSNLVNL